MLKINSSICFSGAIQKIEDAFWISLLEHNSLIKIDMYTGSLEFIDVFQGERQGYQLHAQILQYQNKIIFVPWNASNIAFYDINSNNLRYLSVNNLEKAARYIAGFIVGNAMYLVSETAVKIVKIDLITEVILESYELESTLKKEMATNMLPFMLQGEIWKISEDMELSWKFNPYSKTFNKFNWNIKQDGNFIGRCIGNNYIWLITENDVIYQLTEKGVCRKKYDISSMMNVIFKGKKREYIKYTFLNKSLFIIAYNKNSVIKIPIKENELDIEKYKYQQFENIFFNVEDESLIILFENKLIYIDDTAEREIIFNISSKFLGKMIEKNNKAIKEKNICKLKDFLRFMCECEENVEEKFCNRIIGKEVFVQCGLGDKEI